jgi:hypothetical protein
LKFQISVGCDAFKSVTINFAGVLAKLAQQQTISNLIVKGFRTILKVALWEDSLMPASI